MITDSVIVPLILHESMLNESLDLFINNIEKLKIMVMHKNQILENLQIIEKKPTKNNTIIFKKL